MNVSFFAQMLMENVILKGRFILVSFLGDVAKSETFCPIGVSSWHKLKMKMKANIVILVWKHFMIPDGELFDKAILKRTSKYWRNYRYFLRENYFDRMTRTDDQNYDNRPDRVSKQNWTNLVDYCLYLEGWKFQGGHTISAVLGLLRKEGSSYVNHSAIEMENLKVEFLAVKKQNEDLRQKNQA
ncbi:hypothetical protein RDABS01_021868 [Bienertia sinuspersici]